MNDKKKETILNMSMPEPNTGCWLWTAHTGAYPKIWFKNSSIGAHRASWMLFRGEIPKGMCVLHKCDTTACVNPDHLELGTQEKNIRDCVARGRYNYTDKFKKKSDLEIKIILNDIAVGLSHNKIAKKHNISQSYVSRLKSGDRRSREVI